MKFEAEIAPAAIRKRSAEAQPTVKPRSHRTTIGAAKKKANDGMSGVVSGEAEAAQSARDREVESRMR